MRFRRLQGSGRLARMNLPADLDALSPEQLRALTAQLIAEVEAKDQTIKEKEREASERDQELRYRQTRIDQLYAVEEQRPSNEWLKV